jgi:membrane fusion protein (multidrug efflux system)
MLLTVQVVTAEHQALVVPEGAVFQQQSRAYVYAVDGETARTREIKVGGRRFGIVEVVGGLEEGELIVTEGTIKLRDGSTIRFEPVGAAISERSGGAYEATSASARS